MLLRGDHPGMLISIVKHDARPVVARPGTLRVPEGIVKQNGAPGRSTNLTSAGKKIEALPILRVGVEPGPVTSRYHAELTLTRALHVREVIPYLELQERHRPTEHAKRL